MPVRAFARLPHYELQARILQHAARESRLAFPRHWVPSPLEAPTTDSAQDAARGTQVDREGSAGRRDRG